MLHVGPLGAGQEAKLFNNMVFTAQLALAAEVFDLAAARQLDQQAIATILVERQRSQLRAEVVAGGGFDLEGIGTVAGPLLAKDVGILADHAALTDSTLLVAANTSTSRGWALPAPAEGRQ